ncbi:MAG: DUF4339 domain-containing protein [Pirellulales bacterium]
MGIRFLCPNGHKLNVKAELAGKRGSCPECGAKLTIPAASASPQEAPAAAAAVVVEAAPTGAAWYLRSAAGEQVGPLSELQFRAWIAGGRLAADTLVWREGWAEWKPAHSIPDLLPVPLVAAPPPAPVSEPIVSPPIAAPSEPAPPLAVGALDAEADMDDSIVLESTDAEAVATKSPALAASTYTYHRQRSKQKQLSLAVAMLLVVVVLAGVLLWVVNLNSTPPAETTSPSPASQSTTPAVNQ